MAMTVQLVLRPLSDGFGTPGNKPKPVNSFRKLRLTSTSVDIRCIRCKMLSASIAGRPSRDLCNPSTTYMGCVRRIVATHRIDRGLEGENCTLCEGLRLVVSI